jgi:hypothetical protein
MALTLSGFLTVLVIIVWSLRRQGSWVKAELEGHIPAGLYAVVASPSARARAQWRALLSHGYREWRRARRLHQLCTELAFKRSQLRSSPDDEALAREAKALSREVKGLIA